MATPGTLSFSWRGDTPVLTLVGDIDYPSADVGDEQLDEYRTNGTFVVDLRDVTFIDSVGISLLLRLRHYAGEVRLTAVPSRVHTMLRLTGVEEMFILEDQQPRDQQPPEPPNEADAEPDIEDPDLAAGQFLTRPQSSD